MKKAVVFIAILLGLILNVSWMLEGCNGKLPPLSALVATATPTLAPNWVDNFESKTTSCNPNMYNSNNGLWSYLPTSDFSFGSGLYGTDMGGHISQPTTLMSVPGYTPFQMQLNPNSAGLYNLSGNPYTGIQFYWKTGTGDNMAGKWFICPVPAQIPAPIGNCPGSNCYDTFKQALPGTSGSWQLMSFPWSSMKQAGWGTPVTGPLTAVSSYNGIPNLAQILYFMWEEDPNNPCQAGSPPPPNNPCPSGQIPIPTSLTVDFWVDEIQFY